MRLILAPMEGLADQTLRDILTRLGGIDLCVAEFVRVTNHLLTEKVLLRTVPELANGGCTRAGVPVRLKQWLGMMCAANPEAETLHRTLRTERDPVAVGKMLGDLC